jgi:HEAT repeat protein
MSNAFDQLLESLLDSEAAISSMQFSALSDLNAFDLSCFNQKWRLMSSQRRRTIIAELGRMADEDIALSFEAINRMALEDEDADVRRIAIDNLWESEDSSLVPIFIRALQTDDAINVRASAAKALGVFVLLKEMDELSPATQHEIEEALLSAYRIEQDESIRNRCLESLGFSSLKEVQNLILDSYKKDDEKSIQSALLAMGRSANKSWSDHVITKLTHPTPAIRFEAAKAAGELEIKEAVPELIDLLEDVDSKVMRAALWSLSQIGGEQASEVLLSLFDKLYDEEEIQLLEDALDNLAFVNGTRDMLLFEFDESEDIDT